jgi:hypothetical protein
MKQRIFKPWLLQVIGSASLLFFTSCQKDIETSLETKVLTANSTASGNSTSASEAILLAIDEESIDNGNAPNNFSETDVNDQIARLGQRQTLRYFRENLGKNIILYSGEVGDEGWHAIKNIPSSWISAGPTGNGAKNYLAAGPGLGTGDDGPENLLDKIPNVTPLRAKGLKMLTGRTILAVVYDGDVSINYSPLEGSLKGETLGLVALEILNVVRRTDGSSGSLPKVTVKIVSVDNAKAAALKLFSNAPVPRSSSEPYDINPPSTVPAIVLSDAR